jgi:radical SAM superfamily enzyme YgiQ (UPF0313 family)
LSASPPAASSAGGLGKKGRFAKVSKQEAALILFIEPFSKNIGMYVPAYPLSIMEIASFVKRSLPEENIKVISIPMDYGLPLGKNGKEQIYAELILDLTQLKPKGVGISCTAISQSEEVIDLCNRIKAHVPDTFIFLGGYFPTIYYEEIFSRTSAVDLIVIGEGEETTLKIVELLCRGENPIKHHLSGLVWKQDAKIHSTQRAGRFDLTKKAVLDLDLLINSGKYNILPYAFSRGCPFQCNFCMEDYLRPHRKTVPSEIVRKDLANLLDQNNLRSLLISDALFKSFDLFQFFQSLGIKVNFETRCDVLDPLIIPQIADVCGIMALGFESASYHTLRRMNKVKDRSHYEKYISNTKAIFKQAVKSGIPLMVFMIAGYPGDTEGDLKESLAFARNLSKNKGPGGYVFKIGECHVYPKTKIHNLAVSLPDVEFDDDGVFGQNIVRRPSKHLNHETVLAYTKEIFNLSNHTPKLHNAIQEVMPFFRLPVQALQNKMIPDQCFKSGRRDIFNVQEKSLSAFRKHIPDLIAEYKELMSGERSTRILPL